MQRSTEASPTSRSQRSEKSLTGEVRLVENLSQKERRQMFSLMARYFSNVSRTIFERDLSEKEWCILLTDASEHVKGFSTMMLVRLVVDDRPVAAVYSGDTIVDREHWGESILSRLWSRHAFDLASGIPEAPVYWFLLSSGYKTYRFLTTFFKEFYPTYERQTPPEAKRVMEVLSHARFPGRFDPEAGVVHPENAAPLRFGVADVTDRRLADPHVAFFVTANPGHARGDELVCLTELATENLTPAGRRMLGP
jgi:hypothetical protein